MLRGAEKLVPVEYWCPYGTNVTSEMFSHLRNVFNNGVLVLKWYSDNTFLTLKSWVTGRFTCSSGFILKVNKFMTWGPFTLAKTKIQKTWVFCCTVYTARKTHNIRGFWHEKRMREKTRISYLCFGKWCAWATSLYLWPYTCSAHYVAGRGRVREVWERSAEGHVSRDQKPE